MIINDAQQSIHQGLGFVRLWSKSFEKNLAETPCAPSPAHPHHIEKCMKKKRKRKTRTGSLGLYRMVYSICPLGPSSMSTAPLFPVKPEKMVVPTGVN